MKKIVDFIADWYDSCQTTGSNKQKQTNKTPLL
jgi:hypothetical protein